MCWVLFQILFLFAHSKFFRILDKLNNFRFFSYFYGTSTLLGYLMTKSFYFQVFIWFQLLVVNNNKCNNNKNNDNNCVCVCGSVFKLLFSSHFGLIPVLRILEKLSNVKFVWRCRWCNGYRRRKWTRRHEFKSWTKLIAFHIALIPLGKVWIQLFSLQLWVNSRTD